MINPRDIQTGEVMRCHGCNSRFHLYRSPKCPNNATFPAESNNTDENSNLNVENIYASEHAWLWDFRFSGNKNSLWKAMV